MGKRLPAITAGITALGALVPNAAAFAAEKQGIASTFTVNTPSAPSITVVVVVVLIIVVAIACAVASMKIAEKKGYSKPGFFLLGLILDVLGLAIALCVPSRREPAIDKADQILKYKELLDRGAITQEEFDQKKRELL